MIIRIKKRENPFVQIDKRPLEDDRLSWKAKGILAYLLSRPDDWQVRVTDLVRRSKGSESSVRSGLAELEALGYMTKEQERGGDGNKGQFAQVVYTVYEQPLGGFHQAVPRGGKPHAEKPDAENRSLTDNEFTDNEPTDNSRPPTASGSADAPDPSTMTVREVQALDLNDEAWKAVKAREREGKNRRGVLNHCKAKLDRPPPAVEVVREETHRYPARSWWERIEHAVGDEPRDLRFWRGVVQQWVGLGWNPTNMVGMLEHYGRRDIPNTRPRKLEPAGLAAIRQARAEVVGGDVRRD